ncbi:MAG: acyl-CoA thioesterase [Phycisphaerales bacterium]|nr:MAG: acyl-CoA thioesterase [Phycisphaerales bacterium]
MGDTSSEPAGDRCSVEIRVRYAECDAMGYLHHAKYWEYFEVVRTDLLRRNGFRYRDLEAQGVCFVVYKAAVKYLAPIRYDDLITASVKVERMTRTRVDHSYEIHCAGELTCQASTTLACVDRKGRPRLMPDALWADSSTRKGE